MENKSLMYIVWIAIVVAVLGVAYAYIGWRIIAPFGLPSPWNTVAWISLAAIVVLPILSSILMRTAEGVMDPFAWIGYVGLGFLSLLFTFLLIRDLAWLATLLGVKIYELAGTLLGGAVPTPPDPGRRRMLLEMTNVGVIAAAAALTGYGVFEARRRPGLVEIDVPVSNLPSAFDGFRIVQITDIHAGLTVKRGWVETIAREVDALRPDLIAFTGDLADGTVPHLRGDVAPLGELAAPYGKFFVTGNHEYYSGVAPWLEEVKRMGYDTLINEHRLVEKDGASIVLAGVTDPTGAGFHPRHVSDPEVALRGAPSDRPRILLAHQPRTILQTASLGVDLILSGHTHGGQFFPWNLVATLAQPYISGLHQRENTWIYVSRGTGYWGPPVRLAARSEITIVTLRGAKA